nr:MAG TPA: hypothetical protein [Caudoviricetes sp.]
MVRRYEFKDVGANPYQPYHELVKNDEGDWVSYEDYKDLDDDFQDYITTTDTEIEGLVSRLAEVNAELQKYKDQFPDYVECANCGSITHVEGVEHDGKESAWTVWLEGENPVPGRLVDVKFRDGTIAYKEDSGIYRWWLCNGERGSDIIAYRVVG